MSAEEARVVARQFVPRGSNQFLPEGEEGEEAHRVHERREIFRRYVASYDEQMQQWYKKAGGGTSCTCCTCLHLVLHLLRLRLLAKSPRGLLPHPRSRTNKMHLCIFVFRNLAQTYRRFTSSVHLQIAMRRSMASKGKQQPPPEFLSADARRAE